MILADTSVWVEHFRKGVSRLADLLEQQEVVIHPFVIGELACGHLSNRREILGLLRDLPASAVATDEEVLAFIEARRLMGRGIGWVDAHLLASTVLSDDADLWTTDRRLEDLARELGIAFAEG